MTDQKQPENMEYFNYFGSMITNGEVCIQGILNPDMPWKNQLSTT